ncbi:hypothetical protein [Streptomyces sp. FR-008]|jgi:hypothetical protein|uniref:hypothetical protein n=1 Tax=Streptomyces sp. FR-008 TaxID=206662 RepID=UPI00133155B8|nr:hypothetical protein [Streptomyces sp. FR-008]KAF0794862.1 hypothetical protein P405_17275 [Streptomyces sp. FR-008]
MSGTHLPSARGGEEPKSPGERRQNEELIRSVMSDPGPPTELAYPALLNGIDYLFSVTDLLNGPDPEPRALKFAVLHLQAATEVLLKAGLAGIDWRLVFAKPEEADETSYRTGDFASCGIADTIKRLREHGVAISPEEKGAITALSKERNKLQHFGATLSAAAIEARAGVVLEILMRFINTHLWRGVDADHIDAYGEDMEMILTSVPRIRGYATARMTQLAPELEPFKDTTLRCPACSMWAVVAEGDDSYCRLCSTYWEHEKALLVDYAVGVLGLSVKDVLEDNGGAQGCPECQSHSLLTEVYLADTPDKPRSFCFNCVRPFDGLGTCTRCTLPFLPEGNGDLVCNDCWTAALTSD